MWALAMKSVSVQITAQPKKRRVAERWMPLIFRDFPQQESVQLLGEWASERAAVFIFASPSRSFAHEKLEVTRCSQPNVWEEQVEGMKIHDMYFFFSTQLDKCWEREMYTLHVTVVSAGGRSTVQGQYSKPQRSTSTWRRMGLEGKG